MVLLNDSVVTHQKKGEYTPRYFNPGDLFDEVHLVVPHHEQPDLEALRFTVGRARLQFHVVSAPPRLFLRSLGYRPALLDGWAGEVVKLARRVRPDLIRCYSNTINAYAGTRVRSELGTPLVVSLHANPDTDLRGPESDTLRKRIFAWAHLSIERRIARETDHFVPVYSTITPYLERLGVKAFTLVPNAVGYGAVRKTQYTLGSPVRILCVGRQERHNKDPRPIVEAVARIPGAELSLVGTGNLHEPLRRLARDLGVADRCSFIRAMPNAQILASMNTFDLYAFNLQCEGISKTLMEAASCGLPILLNRSRGREADELRGDWLLRVEDSPAGYEGGIRSLLGDERARASLGTRAAQHAAERWDPHVIETMARTLYERLLPAGDGATAPPPATGSLLPITR